MDIHGYAAALPKGSNIASTLKQNWCLARGHSSTAISNRCSRPFSESTTLSALAASTAESPPCPTCTRERATARPR